MEMLERYLRELGKYLSKKNRNDIQNEVRSVVLEIVDEKKSEGMEEEEAIRASLIMMGSPQELAQKYDSRLGHLVGPELFGIYKMVVGFSILGISIGLTVPLIVQLSFNPDMNVGVNLLKLFGQIFTGTLSIIGSVTLVFYIIQRLFTAERFDSDEEWNPEKLPALPQKAEKINRAGEIAAIVITIVVAFILNFYPEIIGVFYTVDSGPYIFESLLSAGKIKTYLLVLNPLWFVVILVHVYVLARGRRTIASKLINSLLVFGILITLWIMLGDANIIESAGDWAKPFTSSIRMGFAAVMIVLIVDITRYLIVYKRTN